MVPSIGSIIQVFSVSLFFLNPASSLKIEKFGFAFFNSSMIIFSALKSALVTKSKGPFFFTCNFSISPKSLINIFDAFSHALIIIFKLADI